VTAPTLLGHIGAVSGSTVSIQQIEGAFSGISIIGGAAIASVKLAASSGFRRDITTSTGSSVTSARAQLRKPSRIWASAATDG
jgi:hypothetical protein